MILPAVATAVLLVWFYLSWTRARVRGDSYFDILDPPAVPEHWPAVSVIVPARNEAEILPFTLPALLGFFYPQVEFILVDDNSDDGTAESAAKVAEAQGRPLRVIRGAPPADGWRGKLWALEQGIRASSGEWLLMADADMLFHPELLRNLMRVAQNREVQMVSLIGLLRAETIWDRLLLPAFLFFFHFLYPFHQVRNPRSPTAAAAGGCLLVERSALERAGGLAAVRQAWIDDVALAAALKRSGARLYLGASVQVQSFRRYGSLRSIWRMVARSAFTQLRDSWLLVAATLAWIGILFGVPIAGVVVVVSGAIPSDAVATWLSLASSTSISAMIMAYTPALRLYGLHPVRGLTLPLAALLYAAMTLSSALEHSLGNGPQWKGRRRD